MIHISSPGIPLAIAKEACPSMASHEVDSLVFVGKVNADAVEDLVTATAEVWFRREFQVWEAVDKLACVKSIAFEAPQAVLSHVGGPPLSGRGRVRILQEESKFMTCITGVGAVELWSHLSC